MSESEHWLSVIEFLKKELDLVPHSQPAKRLTLCLQISGAQVNRVGIALKNLGNKKAHHFR